MADPYSQALNIAAPFAQLGSQMFQGQNMRDAAYQKQMLQNAQQEAYQGHAQLYGAQAQKAQAEARMAEQEMNSRTPEAIGKLASVFAGLNDPQAKEMQAYQQSGNWGINQGHSLPPELDGPVTPDMPKQAPQWYSPQVQSKYNMGQLAGMVNASATGKTDGVKLFEEMLTQGRIGDALAKNPQALNALQAAMKGKMFENTTRGILNQETGNEAVNADWQNAERALSNQRNASAGASSAQRDLTRSKIGQVTDNGDGTTSIPVTSFGKAPSGYRFKPDGSMEAIPGGPADAKANAIAGNKAAGVTDVNSAVATLRDAYDKLEKGNGITNTDNGSLSNIAASISSSGVGQVVGKAVGTKNQSERNTIAMTRPALLASLMKATGMSAKQMDSNAELKLWMATATDPTLDVQANRAALDKIEQKYLSGEYVPAKSSALSGVPDAAIAKLKADPSLANAFAAKYGKEAADAALGKSK